MWSSRTPNVLLWSPCVQRHAGIHDLFPLSVFSGCQLIRAQLNFEHFQGTSKCWQVYVHFITVGEGILRLGAGHSEGTDRTCLPLSCAAGSEKGKQRHSTRTASMTP